MECIKVRIHQLGRIRDSEILVSPLMVFSGEVGLGKSYLALLCHYFFELLISTNRLQSSTNFPYSISENFGSIAR